MKVPQRASPLRYPGGKAKFAPFIKRLYDENNLSNGHYAEPYAGGAGVAIGLLLSKTIQQAHINDIDKAIYSFWFTLKNYHIDLINKIKKTPVNMDEWHKQKEIMENPENHSILSLGFSTFFLNRTNRSGILKGGVIGGKNQSGKYKIDARFNKENLIKRIEIISRISDKIHLSNLDAIDFINIKGEELPCNSLIYLDPPYYVKGQGLYRNFYSHQDHLEIRKIIDKIKKPWIVSYDNSIEIKEIYKDHPFIEYSLRYSAQTKGKGSEVMFYNKSLKIPKTIP